ncbi:MAG: hypothetical protein EZS28_004728 [Streblomastix strix]|uniref:Uncharacterized protein n=1 Tax=Streblomastix strix TaxID=222440 RepID=A0A5J4WZX0_9EUKA|nr:MAG: hypothetical protein EZS28_004728 [Streblomastix strix]
MSACANSIKYALSYSDFKLDQQYTPKDDYTSFNEIKKEIETQATSSKNPIMRPTKNYSYRQDAISVQLDSKAKFRQHQIELTTTGAILQIT